MIVRADRDRLQLITQPDHAHLAGALMEHCVLLSGHPRRDVILHAIAEHDNGWTEDDAAPAIDTDGRVVDFVSAPLSVRHGVWPRAIRNLSDRPWAAALVAQHAITVYDRYRANPEWTPFFETMEAARGEMQRAAGMSWDDLAADYPFVRLGDLISLVFCTGMRDEQQFGGWTVRLAGSRVVVTPDLFGGRDVPIAIDARALEPQRFRTNDELRIALRAARVNTLSGVVSAV